MKNILLILGVFLSFSFAVQNKSREEAKAFAKSQILQMKEGTLLVRLYDKHNVINALKEKGMKKRAKVIDEKQKQLNKEIIAAFQDFNFCSVLFFYSGDSEHLINKSYSKVTLFSGIEMKEYKKKLDSNFFVADFGYLPSKNKSRTETKTSKKTGRNKQKKYKGTGTNTNIKCMFLRDNKLTQLDKPFPFYVRFHPTPLSQLTYKQVVTKMNDQLNSFYPKK